MLQLLVRVFTELKCKWFDGKIYSRYNHGTKGGNKKQMKKTKSLILGALVACAVVLAMLLAIPANAMMALNANLNVCEEDEVMPVQISFDANGGYGEISSFTCYNSSFELPECTFDAPCGNQYFNCWGIIGTEGEHVEGEYYYPGDIFYTGGVDVTFYAVWKDVPVKEPAVNPVMEASYNGTITVGGKLDLDKVSIIVKKNGNIVEGYEHINEESVNYFIENTSGMEVSYDRINTNEYTFDNVGVIEIIVRYQIEADDFETTMEVTVVAAQVEEPEPAPAPETPEQPEIEEPVVEQPTEEVKPADNDNNGLGLGAILGIVFGSLAVLGLGGSLLWVFVFRK